MDNTNTDIKTSAADVAQEATSSLENKQPQADPIKNLKGEFQRKISKLDEKLTAVLNAVQQGRTGSVSESVDETAEVDTDVKKYVDTAFTHQKQVDAWQEALTMFPELNPESDGFDEKFYKAVDAEFSSNQRRDPKGPLKAAKLAALEMGKFESLTKANLLKDEARRSRIMSEGISTPRDAKKEKDPAATFNTRGLAKLGINPEKLAKRIKDNKDKYE